MQPRRVVHNGTRTSSAHQFRRHTVPSYVSTLNVAVLMLLNAPALVIADSSSRAL
jgi:hypothetical protein